MPIYLVRTIDEHDLVGIFVAASLYALALLVDECVDPGVCECQRMRPGGVMWPDPAVVVPRVYDDDDDEDLAGDEDPIPWAAVSLTESWQDSFYPWSNKGRWRRVPFDLVDLYGVDPEEPDDDPPPKAPTSAPSRTTARILPYRRRDK
jgi:hypothetical protein